MCVRMNLGQHDLLPEPQRAFERLYARDERQAVESRLCPVEERPVRQWDKDEHKLGLLAAQLIDDRDYWLKRAKGEGTQRSDTEEVKRLCADVAKALGAMVGKVVYAQRWHETNNDLKEAG